MKKCLFKKWNYDYYLLNSNNNHYNKNNQRVIFVTNNACEMLHSYIKKMISHNNKENIYVFNNILCNFFQKKN